jgi:hypothetical protein
MEDQPYAPPASVAAEAARREAELPRTGVALMILFTLLTLGLYVPYWFLNRRKAFNRLAPEGETVDLITFSFAALYFFAFALGLVSGLLRNVEPVASLSGYSWVRILDFASRVFVIIISFRFKLILEAEYPGHLSTLGTFFLSLYYLQYKINRLGDVDPIAERFTLR